MADNGQKPNQKLNVPRTIEEANKLIVQMAELIRANSDTENRANAEVDKIREAATAETKPRGEEINRLLRSLQIFANLKRGEIEAEGKKSATLPAGVLGWRLTPPAVEKRSSSARP